MDTSDPEARTVGRRWHVLGFALLTAAGFYAVAVSLALGLWRQNSPGEGLFPFITATLVTVFGLAALLGAWRAGVRPMEPPASLGDVRPTVMRVGAYLAGLAVYAATLEALGFLAATVLVVTFILRAAEGYPWRTTLALAIGAALVCHVVFVRWLGAILPAGYLWERVLS